MTQPQPVRALALARECLPKSKDADYIIRLLETKARRAQAIAPAKAKRQVTRKLLKAAGLTPKDKRDWRIEADKWFARFIRLRDTKVYPSGDRLGFCVTCRKFLPISELDCGHWIRRENWATRFDEQNCHAQCRQENFYRGGMEQEHEAFIQKKYGQTVTARLLLSKRLKARKPSAAEFEAIAKKYEAKVAELGGWPEK